MTNYLAALVDELYQLGIKEVVISPGSRSTPLAMLFCEHDFKTFINIDERSAGFFALGIAKEQRRPVVLLCTSGSAVANYFPAIVEAYHSAVPLIVLTADRPHELRNVGAPQTINQNNIFQSFVKLYEELALPEETDHMCRYARVVMQKGYHKAMVKPFGVVHINVPLREPLVPNFEQLDFQIGRTKYGFSYDEGKRQVSFDETQLEEKNGIILCGVDSYLEDQLEIIALAERLKAPIIADPLSNLRRFSSPYIIDSYDGFLKSDEVKVRLEPDYVIHFGQGIVSKRMQQFLSKYSHALYIHVGENMDYSNPILSTNYVVDASAKAFCQSIMMVNYDEEYSNRWLSYQKMMRKKLNQAKHEEELFEGQVVRLMQDTLPDDSRLVVANSMAIRDIDYFFVAKDQSVKILCNRGANGIDGTISTAMGIATAGYPTVLLTGDLACYHDLNGLLVGVTHEINLTIVLLNNNGGGIFHYLPQSKERNFERLFLTPHHINFAGLEQLYGITYHKVKSAKEFAGVFAKSTEAKGIQMIEVSTNSARSKEIHDSYTIL